MNRFIILAFLFFVGCVAGWVLELFFRRYSPTGKRKWVNPGFLVGPYLPVYGFGLLALFFVAQIMEPFIGNGIAGKIITYLIMLVVLTLIEYIAGLIFIKGLKVKLWDYSNMWGNVQGIICPLFSAMWAALGAVYYFIIHPRILNALDWLSRNLAFTFVIGFFYGIFVIDCVHSFKVVAKVRKFAKDNNIIVYYDEFKDAINDYKAVKAEKPKFIYRLGSEDTLAGSLKMYSEKLSDYRKKVDAARKKYNEDIGETVSKIKDDNVEKLEKFKENREEKLGELKDSSERKIDELKEQAGRKIRGNDK